MKEDCLNDECNGEYTASTVMVVFLSVVIGTMQISFAAPYIEALSAAKSAASSIYQTVDRITDINSASILGKKMGKNPPKITFRNVCFNYPARANVSVLNDLTMTINEGK